MLEQQPCQEVHWVSIQPMAFVHQRTNAAVDQNWGTIHVWYIYPTWMLDFYGKYRYIYHTWILWERDPRVFLMVSSCLFSLPNNLAAYLPMPQQLPDILCLIWIYYHTVGINLNSDPWESPFNVQWISVVIFQDISWCMDDIVRLNPSGQTALS